MGREELARRGFSNQRIISFLTPGHEEPGSRFFPVAFGVLRDFDTSKRVVWKDVGEQRGKGGLPKSIYGLVYEAIRDRRTISAIYHELPRLFCPHRLGRNSKGELRVLCYQYGGESETGLGLPGSSDNWRCIAVKKLNAVQPREDPWQTAPNHSRPASCIVDPDIDAEDYPERDQQKGQPLGSPNR